MNNIDLSYELLAHIPEFPLRKLKPHAKTADELVELLLEYELENIRVIVDKEFKDENAIDDILQASQEIAKEFDNIFPSLLPQIKQKYPMLYHDQFQKRIDLISKKIRYNLDQGIAQGLYRSDFSSELISRLYLSRLIDIHNQEYFPSASFSFDVLFNQMFGNLIRSIATPKGLAHFEEQLSLYSQQ